MRMLTNIFDAEHDAEGDMHLRDRDSTDVKTSLLHFSPVRCCSAWIAGILAFSSGAALADTGGPGAYGQHLLDGLAKLHPEVVALSIDVTPPKESHAQSIAATGTARVGTPTGGADLEVLKDGETRSEVDERAGRIKVELPLHDVSNSTIGVLDVTYAFRAGADRASLERSATELRDALHRRISHVANLLEPYPYDPSVPSNTYAQQLVDETLAKYPGVEIFALHATPPGAKENIIIGSNIGRIGKKGDEDDMRVVTSGKPNLEVNDGGNRFEVEMQLRDREGRVIGAVSTVFPYRKGDDKAALRARGEAINAELQPKIPDAASLFRTIP